MPLGIYLFHLIDTTSLLGKCCFYPVLPLRNLSLCRLPKVTGQGVAELESSSRGTAPEPGSQPACHVISTFHEEREA